MPRIVFNDKNIARGKNFEKVCEILFPKASREKIGALLGGVPGNTIKNWQKGSSIANRALVELARRGVSLTWLLASEGEMFLKSAQRENVDETSWEGNKTEIGEMDEEQKWRGYEEIIDPPASGPGPSPFRDPAEEHFKRLREDEAKKRFAFNPRVHKPNAVRRKGDQDAAHRVLHLKAVGNAAALEKGSSIRGIFDDEGGFWDEEEIPETTHLVRVRGDSMYPMIMHGQYAMVGPQYMFERGDVPGDRDIVIAEIVVQENDIGGVDSEWEGVHCKRIQDAGDLWLFTSINPSGASFTVAKDNCRLWRVIGVYFAGKGKPPEED